MRFSRLLTVAVIASSSAVVATGCSTTPPPASDKVSGYYESHKDLQTPEAKAAAVTTVSILSDSHANNADSWWRQTVVANKVPGLTIGAFESQPGAMSTSLAARLDAAAAKKGKVIVQAGTNDLLSGSTPADAAAGVEKLWAGIKERGATPVAALVPPSDAHGPEVIELNAILSRAATVQQMPIIDVYTPVADKDGSWADGMTADGVHANKAGSDLMTAAAMKQLPSLAG